MDKQELKFIDKLYKDLYLTKDVLHHSTGSKTDKYRNIKEYLEKLEDIHDRSMTAEARKARLKKLYHDKYVINPEQIPNSYYENQVRIALESGFGHIEITGDQKRELQREVINNQIKSLDTWLDYFLSEDSKVYPFWAKYWAFQGMLKLGTYNKKERKFNKRTEDTVAPFADLNREALAISIDVVVKHIHKQEITDKDLENLVKSGSFQRVYTYILKNILSNNQNISKRDEGRWVKYNQGSDHMPLVKSLQGYNTGWCTAGEATAKSQLSMGDFYVYYTLDENEEYKVPRIAIRMEDGNIGEIRGIASDQNLEPEMEDVVAEKIKDFPDKDKYYKKVNDMKLLTNIYNKQEQGMELTKEELRFLYEIDSKIEGFGWEEDPRIKEIKKQRDVKKDLALIYNCKENEIATTFDEKNENTKVYDGSLVYRNLTNYYSITHTVIPPHITGDLHFTDLKSAKDLTLPKSIGGSLYLNSLAYADGLLLPESIGDNLELIGLTYAGGLILPRHIKGSLNLNGLVSAKGLILPEKIDGNLYLNELVRDDDLILPKSIGGSLYLYNIAEVENLIFPERIGNNLELRGLKSAASLILPKVIGGNLFLGNLISAKDLVFPERIGGELKLTKLKSAASLILPKSIGGSLYLNNLTSAEDLALPQTVGGNLYLNNLTSAKDLVLPQTVGGNLYLNGLTSVKGLKLPKSIGENIVLDDLTNAEDLTFPKTLYGCLYLNNLETAKNLILPECIGNNLFLDNLNNAENLTLPKTIMGNYSNHNDHDLNLLSLTSATGLIIPDPLTYTIHCKGFDITPENVDKYRSKIQQERSQVKKLVRKPNKNNK